MGYNVNVAWTGGVDPPHRRRGIPNSLQVKTEKGQGRGGSPRALPWEGRDTQFGVGGGGCLGGHVGRGLA